MKIVIDTSILIDYLRGGNAWHNFLMGVEQDAQLFLPTIVVYELFSGKSSKKALVSEDIFVLIKKFKKIELDAAIAKRAGELYRDLGIHLGAQDYIIAASAFSIDAAVLTLNTKHFEQIPNLRLYSL